eukprot:COSAG04_NODE_3344_length_2910_cov_13.065813_1_plen_25_part_10
MKRGAWGEAAKRRKDGVKWLGIVSW